jgi:hypothetical protein
MNKTERLGFAESSVACTNSTGWSESSIVDVVVAAAADVDVVGAGAVDAVAAAAAVDGDATLVLVDKKCRPDDERHYFVLLDD